MLYPKPSCLRIFTDGSHLSDSPNAGARVFSEIFSFCVPMGRGTALDESEAPSLGCPTSTLSMQPVSVGKNEESRKYVILIFVY
ncbi:hypothetical protein TNCV_2850681 [Trichonephila clavipes]|nr:hypothetical protein TNCV_2850681 [Trichonephila clavipes]